LGEFFDEEGYPACSASAGTGHLFPPPLRMALSQSLLPLMMQLTVALTVQEWSYVKEGTPYILWIGK